MKTGPPYRYRGSTRHVLAVCQGTMSSLRLSVGKFLPSCELVHDRTQSPETEATPFRACFTYRVTTPDSMLRWCFLAAHFLLKIVGVGFPGSCETVKRRSRVDHPCSQCNVSIRNSSNMLPLFRHTANGRKKMWYCKLQCLRGNRWSSLLRRLWSTLPLRSG